MHFVMGCGWYRGNYYLPEERIDRRSANDLAEELIREITDGVGDTGIRPGVIGEIGSEKDWVSAAEERVLRAVARAHKATGLSIGALHAIGPGRSRATHHSRGGGRGPDPGGGGPLRRLPAPPLPARTHRERCVRHVRQLRPVPGDWAGSRTVSSTSSVELVDRGFEDRLMLSHDVCKLGQLRIHGGTGFVYLSETFLPALSARGVPDETIRTMTHDNPRRWLTGT